nr:hypothetical protein CFP56_54173 [Quercus suber]
MVIVDRFLSGLSANQTRVYQSNQTSTSISFDSGPKILARAASYKWTMEHGYLINIGPLWTDLDPLSSRTPIKPTDHNHRAQ